MADAGILTVFCECARGLGDSIIGDIFGNQDPYLVLKVAKVERRTRAVEQGGKFPVWNETITFQLGQSEQAMSITMWDKCMLKDMKLGTATVGLERVRREGSDRMQVPLMKNDKPNAECMGIVSLAMTFHNGNGAPPPMPMGPVVGAPAMHAASPIHGQQMPMAGYGYGMPHPGPAMGMPAGYGQEPAGYYPPQDGPPQGYPPQGYPPQGQGFQDQDQYPPPQGQGYPPQGQGGPYQQQQGAPPPGYPTGKS